MCTYNNFIDYCLVSPDDTPTIAQLTLLKPPAGKKIRLIKSLSAYWKELAYLLEFDASGMEVRKIEKRCRGDHDECCREMFCYWLEGNGVRPHSWRKLIELIDDCGQEVLAVEIQNALSLNKIL